MNIINSTQQALLNYDANSLFLVGPTPRIAEVQSWRPEAISILEEIGFQGTILIPEPFAKDYDTQLNWEFSCLCQCGLVVAWVPRKMDTMPALTTNVEFGYWLGANKDKLLYGRPDGAEHTRYLDWMYTKCTDKAPFDNLRDLLVEANRLLRR